MKTLKSKTIEDVKQAALSSFSPEQLRTMRISMESRVRKAGTTVGPSHSRHTLRHDGILVFVDPYPRANFAHDCLYVFYDPRNPGKKTETFEARFPPQSAYVAGGLTVIHEPPPGGAVPARRSSLSPPTCSREVSNHDNRFALLWSGMTSTWHMNDLEFCYRMLLRCYQFKPENILIASFDGTFNTVQWRNDNSQGDPWPGDQTPYQIEELGKPAGQRALRFTGNRAGMQAAIAQLRERFPQRRLPEGSLLFLYTSGHGEGRNGEPFLCEFPDDESYTPDALISDIKPLEPDALLVTMTQCSSGGFGNFFLQAGLKARQFFAAACGPTDISSLIDEDKFGGFAFHWIAAQRGFDPKGNVTSGLRTVTPNIVTAEEAFEYAKLQIAAQKDNPLATSAGNNAIRISLG